MDRRSKAEKLRAMARDTSSPNEAAIAKRMLEGMTEAEPTAVRFRVEQDQTTTFGSVSWTFTFHADRG